MTVACSKDGTVSGAGPWRQVTTIGYFVREVAKRKAVVDIAYQQRM